jgi:solute carrier family 25 phosphate transporter 23/24/25/41
MFGDLMVGGSAAVISRTLTAPLELYKIQCQNRYMKESTLRNVIRREGVRYLWKGNGINSFRAFPQFAINYATFEKVKNENFFSINSETHQNFVAGGFAGITAMICIYPMETIRTRLSLQMCKSHYSTPYVAFKTMTWRELYRGLGTSLLGFGPFSAFNYMFYHYYKDHLMSKQYDPSVVKLLAGGLSGLSAVTITYPTDIIRKRLQMQGFDPSVPSYNGIGDCAKKMAKEGGVLSLYRGLLPTYVRIFPCFAIQFWCFEIGKQLIGF